MRHRGPMGGARAPCPRELARAGGGPADHGPTGGARAPCPRELTRAGGGPADQGRWRRRAPCRGELARAGGAVPRGGPGRGASGAAIGGPSARRGSGRATGDRRTSRRRPGAARPVTKRACSEHRKATTWPKSSGSPMTPAGMPSLLASGSPPVELRASGRWRGCPGWTELTVTPSAATSRASVLRKPVAPARAVFDRISVGDRLAHRDRRDRHHPPPALLPHRRDGGLAHRHDREQVQLERGRIGVDRRWWRSCPAVGRRRW